MPAPASPVNRTALALYRELYRHTRALPRDSLDYYRNYLRCVSREQPCTFSALAYAMTHIAGGAGVYAWLVCVTQDRDEAG
jgi:hypothetical protein